MVAVEAKVDLHSKRADEEVEVGLHSKRVEEGAKVGFGRAARASTQHRRMEKMRMRICFEVVRQCLEVVHSEHMHQQLGGSSGGASMEVGAGSSVCPFFFSVPCLLIIIML